MTPAEIAAYIGAAAWFPHIATWIYRKVVQPVVTIVPDKYAEVGFTSFGPIFNLRMAFSTENRDLIIDGFELLMQHSDGDTHTLRWSGLAETFGDVTDAAGNRQVISRDQVPIALKIGTESLIEKLVRFQEPRYHEEDRRVLLNLTAHNNFLKRSSPTDHIAQTLSSRECSSVIETRQNSLWWKAGCYQITLLLTSPRKFKLKHSQFHFDLTSIDIDRLKQNTSAIESDLRNIISSESPDFTLEPVNWNWATVKLLKT